MDFLVSISAGIWQSLAPTTWALLALVASYTFIRKLLF